MRTLFPISCFLSTINKYAIQGVIIENTFTSIKDVGANFMPGFIMKFADLVLNNKWETYQII